MFSQRQARLRQARELPAARQIRSNEAGSEKVLGTDAAEAAIEIATEIEIGAETKIATVTRTKKKKKRRQLRSRNPLSASKWRAFRPSSSPRPMGILATGILRRALACHPCSLMAHRQELHRLQPHPQLLHPPQVKDHM